MGDAYCLLSGPVSYCLNSLLRCNAMQLSRYYFFFSLKSMCFVFTRSTSINPNGSERTMQEEESVRIEESEKYGVEYELTSDDINIVMNALNIEGYRNVDKMDREIIEGVYELLENKDASLKELKQAFNVFDGDEDGFISAFELWSVLRRLGFKEGLKYEDCEKMIRSFDHDGDEMINFGEFKNMMENAI